MFSTSGGGRVAVCQAFEEAAGKRAGKQRGAGQGLSGDGGGAVTKQVLLDGRALVREAVRGRHRVAQRRLHHR
jgi:hypothetical protein